MSESVADILSSSRPLDMDLPASYSSSKKKKKGSAPPPPPPSHSTPTSADGFMDLMTLYKARNSLPELDGDEEEEAPLALEEVPETYRCVMCAMVKSVDGTCVSMDAGRKRCGDCHTILRRLKETPPTTSVPPATLPRPKCITCGALTNGTEKCTDCWNGYPTTPANKPEEKTPVKQKAAATPSFESIALASRIAGMKYPAIATRAAKAASSAKLIWLGLLQSIIRLLQGT